MVRGTALVVIALFWLSGTALTGAQTTEKNGEKKSLKQFLHVYNYDPRELHEIWQESEQRKHLAGPFWLGGYYIPPSQQPGPGPPLQIWGRGFGTSLWRDPVTGWPIR